MELSEKEHDPPIAQPLKGEIRRSRRVAERPDRNDADPVGAGALADQPIGFGSGKRHQPVGGAVQLAEGRRVPAERPLLPQRGEDKRHARPPRRHVQTKREVLPSSIDVYKHATDVYTAIHPASQLTSLTT